MATGYSTARTGYSQAQAWGGSRPVEMTVVEKTADAGTASGAARGARAQTRAKGSVSFSGTGDFSRDVRALGAEYMSDSGNARRARLQIYIKSAIMVLWAATSWALLVFVASSFWVAALLCLSLGLALAGVGFNVTHDANHGSYSPARWLNSTMRWSLDFIGGSSYVWRVKHNVVHHTYTNIAGADSDIEQLPFLRLAPAQPHRWFHRYQHIYVWPLYGLFALKWHLLSDLLQLRAGNVQGTPLPWPRGRELVGFWLGKAVFFTWAIAIPLFLHPVWIVALAFTGTSLVLAFTLALTFQLAHCVEEATVTSVDDMADAGRSEWSRHQVETTVDFAPNNPLAAWYFGGLNFQIEHHVFSKICHTNYPKLAPHLQELCKKHGVRYSVHRTVTQALLSHVRYLRNLGRLTPAAASG